MSMWMLCSQEIGIKKMQSGIRTLQGQELAISSFMLHVQSCGLPSYMRRLLFQKLRANIWQFEQPQERCFHWWSWCQKCKILWFDSNNSKVSLSCFWRQQRRRWAGFKRQESEDASKNTPHQHQVSSFQEQGSRWKYLHSSCLSQQKTRVQKFSPKSAMKRLTPSCASNWWVGNWRTLSSKWGSKRKSTVLAPTVANHTLPLLPSVCQPKFSVSPASVLFLRLSHASVRCALHWHSHNCFASLFFGHCQINEKRKSSKENTNWCITTNIFYMLFISIYHLGFSIFQHMNCTKDSEEQSKNRKNKESADSELSSGRFKFIFYMLSCSHNLFIAKYNKSKNQARIRRSSALNKTSIRHDCHCFWQNSQASANFQGCSKWAYCASWIPKLWKWHDVLVSAKRFDGWGSNDYLGWPGASPIHRDCAIWCSSYFVFGFIPLSHDGVSWSWAHTGGCTSLFQPVDIGVNKPFKNQIRQQWEQWMIAEW